MEDSFTPSAYYSSKRFTYKSATRPSVYSRFPVESNTFFQENSCQNNELDPRKRKLILSNICQDASHVDDNLSGKKTKGSNAIRTPLPHICEEPGCNESFATAREWKTHLAQHNWGPHDIRTDPNTGDVVFCCLHPGCSKKVYDRKLLRKHLLTHKEKQFTCHYEGCNKQFYERAKLKRHYLVHTGEKAFHCTYPNCDKRFGYKANLKTHLRTHTGLRPFKCTVEGCERRFAQASNRNSHVLTHKSTPPQTVEKKRAMNASKVEKVTNRPRRVKDLRISVDSRDHSQGLPPSTHLLKSFLFSPSLSASLNSITDSPREKVYREIGLDSKTSTSYDEDTSLDNHAITQVNFLGNRSAELSLPADAYSILSTPKSDARQVATFNLSTSLDSPFRQIGPPFSPILPILGCVPTFLDDNFNSTFFNPTNQEE